MSSGGASAVIVPTACSASASDTATSAANQLTSAAALRLDDFDDGEPQVWQAAERTITPMFEIAAANSTAPTSASVSKSNSELSVRYAEPRTSRFVLSRAEKMGKENKEENYSFGYFMPKPDIIQKI